ncbi:MAG: hypothetical protein WA063_06520, partial [Minisyncoccia bacterium]
MEKIPERGEFKQTDDINQEKLQVEQVVDKERELTIEERIRRNEYNALSINNENEEKFEEEWHRKHG